MSRAARISLVAAVLFPGCATVLNVFPIVEIRHLEHFELTVGAPRAVYGGVRLDAAIASRAAQRIAERPLLATPFLLASVVDLPLSAVGDTLTLPVTIPASIEKSVADYYFPDGAEAEREPAPIESPQADSQRVQVVAGVNEDSGS